MYSAVVYRPVLYIAVVYSTLSTLSTIPAREWDRRRPHAGGPPAGRVWNSVVLDGSDCHSTYYVTLVLSAYSST